MSSRRIIRSRRFASGLVGPSPVWWANFEASNVTKTTTISQTNNLGSLGSAEALTQGTALRQPLWTDNGAPSGTMDIADFDPDGVNLKSMTRTPTSAYFGLNGYTVFLVFNRVSSTGQWTLFTHNNGSLRGGWALQVTPGAAGRSFQARTSAGTVKSITFGTYTLNTWEIWTIKNWGGGSDDVASDAYFKTRVNGTEVAWAVLSGGPWFWIPTGSFATSLNTSTITAGNRTLYGDARAYDRVLSDVECLTIERQLGALYGITVA